METFITPDAKAISNRLKKEGYSKKNPFVFEKPVTIALCIDSRKYYYEYERKVHAIWPEGDTFTATVSYQSEIWQGDNLIKSETVKAEETIDASRPSDFEEYSLCEFHSYNIEEITRRLEDITCPVIAQEV